MRGGSWRHWAVARGTAGPFLPRGTQSATGDGGAGGRPEGTPPAPPSPVKNSPELTVTERFTLSEDGTVLHREYQFVDPLYLEVPITGSDEVVLTSDAYEPYHCDDLTNERSQ